jgi:HAD superfamily 5'-nucleotidase-like hydrolase
VVRKSEAGAAAGPSSLQSSLIKNSFLRNLRSEQASRIFVNRNLRMARVEAIGFDMDHTLARYAPEPFEALAFEATKEKLLTRRYPSWIASIPYEEGAVIRGLVVDRKLGNVLKLDAHKYVSTARHGLSELPAPERKRLYRGDRVRLSAERFVSVDSLFSFPEIYLYMRIVERLDLESNGGPPDYDRLYTDVRAAIDEAHADGSIKRDVVRDPGKYLQRDPLLAATLDEFRRHGKRLFLLTNSEPDYTHAVMSHLLADGGPDARPWFEHFDLVFTGAGKPAFFVRGRKPEAHRFPGQEGEAWGGAANGRAWTGGNARFLEAEIGVRGDLVLYFGDHTYGDILRSKKYCGWRTAMVIQELEHELGTSSTSRPLLADLAKVTLERNQRLLHRAYLEKEWARLRLQRERLGASVESILRNVDRKIAGMEELLRKLESEVEADDLRSEDLEAEMERAYNSRWGPLFKVGNETSRFGHQVKDFACIYTSRVSNFLNYPIDHYFRAPGIPMPHELE